MKGKVYTIVYKWDSTSNNHAGMYYFATKLASKYSEVVILNEPSFFAKSSLPFVVKIASTVTTLLFKYPILLYYIFVLYYNEMVKVLYEILKQASSAKARKLNIFEIILIDFGLPKLSYYMKL